MTMLYKALAVDYDGTLAHDGQVSQATVAALERLKTSGRYLILVTGRIVDELLNIFPDVGIFDLVVAEDGAVLFDPRDRSLRPLGDPPSAALIERLRGSGVYPLNVGTSIVATCQPHEVTALEVIRELGLELQIIFNKGSVMILPANVNKASGMLAALRELGLSPHNVIAVGDAENDHAFLRIAEFSAAVSNAIDSLKAGSDLVLTQPRGDGVVELIDALLAGRLSERPAAKNRHRLLLGMAGDREMYLPAGGVNVLIAGPSGSGKSTFARGLIERMIEQRYQLCVIDPEGDYEDLEGTVSWGTPQAGPSADQALQALSIVDDNVVLDLVGLPFADRRRFFLSLLPRLQQMRASLGRPHWILVDEAHHLLPAGWEQTQEFLAEAFTSMIYVTVDPQTVANKVLGKIDVVAALGDEAETVLRAFAEAAERTPPSLAALQACRTKTGAGNALIWWTASDEITPVCLVPTAGAGVRHRRKYAQGELPADRSFVFRGPEGKLRLRAHNLALFLHLAEGVDTETWLYHLKRRDYSEWIRLGIKDEELADEVRAVEEDDSLDADASRDRVIRTVRVAYTLPESDWTWLSREAG